MSRIIEVATNGACLSVERGFMKVRVAGSHLGEVPLDDIQALVVHGHGASFSANLIARLAQRGCPLVICNQAHSPVGMVLPVEGNYEQGLRMEAQAAASKPTRKRLWQQIVQAKIKAQAQTLQALGKPSGALANLAKQVRSGDPANIEGQAARRYWRTMFGTEFRRNRDAEGTNALLNYGYMVLRASAARSIVAAGLHPSLSLHHVSRGSPLRLADDLMEPFRPFIDLAVARRSQRGAVTLDTACKAELAGLLTLDLAGPCGASPLQTSIDRLATSLAQVFTGSTKRLELPGPALDLTLADTSLR